MNDLPQRPKFYLHRSRRFWVGFVILILLFGWWHLSQRNNVRYYLIRWEMITPGHEDWTDSLHLDQLPGLLKFRYDHSDHGNLGVSRSGHWEFDTDKLYVKSAANPYIEIPDNIWPTARFAKNGGSFGWGGTFPIWLIILLWTILWPLWMRRGDKLEEKRFGSG